MGVVCLGATNPTSECQLNIYLYIPSGKGYHNYGKIHHFQWVNQLFRLGHGFNSKL